MIDTVGVNDKVCVLNRGGREMSTSKEAIYELMKEHYLSLKEGEDSGLETSYIATKLDMKRPNVSTILNKLVKEGKVIKKGSRPVLYYIASPESFINEKSCFKDLIGFNGSLKNVIQLAKASILYPKKSLNTLIIGESGTGKSYLAKLMYQFAKENKILDNDAPFIKVNCRHYVEDMRQLEHDLYGKADENFVNYFDKAASGVLFIDNVDLMEGRIRNRLNHFLDYGEVIYDDSIISINNNTLLILSCNSSVNTQVIEGITSKIPVKIELPSLKVRPLEERFSLINYFFQKEARKCDINLKINSELITCLLLYECTSNIKQLKNDIRIACANSFVRNYGSDSNVICLYLSDFENYVRKGFLNYKKYSYEIQEIIPNDYSYIFKKDSSEVEKSSDIQKNISIYDYINNQFNELKDRGIEKRDIDLIVSSNLKNSFEKYNKSLASKIVNTDQLSKLVSPTIINLVSNFLDNCKEKFSVNYPPSVFYGLCLHINSLSNRKKSGQRLKNEQIMDIIDRYYDEYTCCLKFASELEEKLNIKIPIDEVVLFAMFIVEVDVEETTRKPQVLYVLHGNGTATSISNVVNNLVKAKNTYAYDLSLDRNPLDMYEELKSIIQKIDNGSGIIVIYDMGSIKTMLETIIYETNIEIRMICMPITLVGLDASRKCMLDSDIDNVYHGLIKEVNELFSKKQGNEVIITLCNTGEGGAIQLKDYIEKYSKLNYDIVPLAISNKKILLSEVKKIREIKDIHAFVGAYNPKLFGIPFIPMSDILNVDPSKIDRILDFTMEYNSNIDYEPIYEYLNEQLEHISINKLKQIVPKVIEDIKKIEKLSDDQEMGLFVHIACLINRLLGNERIPKNVHTHRYIMKYEVEFKELLKVFKRVEKRFKVVISDDEIAHILAIIKKL